MLGLRPQNHKSAEVSAVRSPRTDRWRSGNSLGRERNAMVALGRLTAATVLCIHKMVAEARRSDQIAVCKDSVRSQRQRKASAARTHTSVLWSQREINLVRCVCTEFSLRPVRCRYVSLPSLLRFYCASTERYWLLPAHTTSTQSSRCDYAARYTLMRVQWRSSDVCSRLTVRWWAVMW